MSKKTGAAKTQKKGKGSGKSAVAESGSGHAGAPPYVIVFALLAVLTVIEIYVSGWDIGKSNQILLLMILASSKAALVALYYMHLRYESRILRWIAVIPVAFAVGLAYVMVVV